MPERPAPRQSPGRDKDATRCFHSRKADKACSELADTILEELRLRREEAVAGAAGEGEGAGGREARGGAAGGRQRYIVGVAGCPGSGKSTLSKRLCTKLNAKFSEGGGSSEGSVAVVVPMDGFHLTRKQLDAMQQPALAHKRRGAHWTFDAEGFVAAVASVRAPGSAAAFPSFDHAVGDPAPGTIRVEAHHQVVIVEGLYLFLDAPPWNRLMTLFDKRVFIKCPIGLALTRVMHRKTHTLGTPERLAEEQVEFNDKRNAITVWKSRNRADLFIPS